MTIIIWSSHLYKFYQRLIQNCVTCVHPNGFIYGKSHKPGYTQNGLLYPPQTKLRGYIVILMFTTWCHTAPPILSFKSNDFGVSQSKRRTLPYKTWGSGGYHVVSIAHSISSFPAVYGHEINSIDIFTIITTNSSNQFIYISFWFIFVKGWSQTFNFHWTKVPEQLICLTKGLGRSQV